MKIMQRSAFATRLSGTLYKGTSPPISLVGPADKPLSLEWWNTNRRKERSGSQRHMAALQLYLQIAKFSKVILPEHTFPSQFDFDDASMRPDKGAIKVFLEEQLIEPRTMGAQLVFDVTSAGQNYLSQKMPVARG